MFQPKVSPDIPNFPRARSRCSRVLEGLTLFYIISFVSWKFVSLGQKCLYLKHFLLHKRLGINANGSSMTDFHREIIFVIWFFFRQSFSLRILPQKNVLFLIYAFLGGCEDDLYISSQQIDGWAFITFFKHPIDDPFRVLSWSFFKIAP